MDSINKGFVFGAGFTNCDILYAGLPAVPTEGTELYSTAFDIQIGGGPPTTLINLQKLNVPVRLATFVGDTLFCGLIKEEYRRHRMDFLNLYQGEGMPITVTSALITERDRTFVSYREDIDITDKIIEDMLSASHGASFAIMGVHFPQLHKEQKQQGAKLILDTGWDESLSLEAYADYIDIADYYTPSRSEALKITGSANVDDALDILSRYFPQAMVKLDREGCLIKEGGVKTLIPPLTGITAVDATGAGDTFLSGFLYGLYHGHPFADCVRFGNITGGICVQAIGCLGKQVDEKELLALW